MHSVLSHAHACDTHLRCVPFGSQFTHAAPPLPQTPSAVPAWQAPPVSQQPPGQFVALHAAQALLVQYLPAPAVQSAHAAPLFPHCVFDSEVMQFPLVSQHPPAQLDGPQLTQVWVAAQDLPVELQFSQVTPLPHAVSAVPGMQTPVVGLQQPLGQFAALHASQACPEQTLPLTTQFSHAAPPAPHVAFRLPGWHLPSASQQPPAQVFASHGSHALL